MGRVHRGGGVHGTHDVVSHAPAGRRVVAGVHGVLRDARLSLDDVYAKLKHRAATKEALRVVPQTAGGLRVNPTLRTLAEWRSAECMLTADPRVAFLDEANFPAPDRYRPERFLDTNANDPDAFFPGGMGQHRCPGISLSTLMTQIFLTYATSTFDGWSPDLEGEGSEDPEYIQVPIVIIDDKYGSSSNETGSTICEGRARRGEKRGRERAEILPVRGCTRRVERETRFRQFIRPRGRFRFVRVTTVLPVHPVVDRGSGVRDERGPGAISRFANREKSRSDAARRRSIFGSDAGASTRSNPRFWVHGSDSEKASRCNIHDRRQVGPRGYMFDPARATAIQHARTGCRRPVRDLLAVPFFARSLEDSARERGAPKMDARTCRPSSTDGGYGAALRPVVKKRSARSGPRPRRGRGRLRRGRRRRPPRQRHRTLRRRG